MLKRQSWNSLLANQSSSQNIRTKIFKFFSHIYFLNSPKFINRSKLFFYQNLWIPKKFYTDLLFKKKFLLVFRKSQRLLALSDFWEHDETKTAEEMLRIKLEEEKLRREVWLYIFYLNLVLERSQLGTTIKKIF